jgi:hypothetical protein
MYLKKLSLVLHFFCWVAIWSTKRSFNTKFVSFHHQVDLHSHWNITTVHMFTISCVKGHKQSILKRKSVVWSKCVTFYLLEKYSSFSMELVQSLFSTTDYWKRLHQRNWLSNTFILWQHSRIEQFLFSSFNVTSSVFPIQLATKFRTCTFDRPGRILTSPLPNRTPDQTVTDLMRDLTSIIDYMYVYIYIHINSSLTSSCCLFICLKTQNYVIFSHFRGNKSRVVLIGHSLGANIATLYALTVCILKSFFIWD